MKRLFTLMFVMLLIQSTNSQETATEQPMGRLSGVFFMDYYYNLMRDPLHGALSNTVLKGEQDVHGFQVRRIYLTYDYRFNSKFSSKLRLESDEANFTSNLAGNKANKFGMFVKDAYIKWNYFGNHDIYVGIQGTPGFEVSERVWGNRYIEKTIMDVRGICPSRDIGLSFRGNIDPEGVLKYWIMVANGNAGLPEMDKYKRYYGHLEVNPVKNFIITLFADYQSKSPIDNEFSPGQAIGNDIFTTALLLGYRESAKYSFGIETFYRKTENAVLLSDSYDDAEGIGYSVFATYYFNENLNMYARYDQFDPNLHKDALGDSRSLIIAGVAYKPAPNFTISPNLFIETFEETDGQKIKNSVTPRVTALWSF